MQKSQAPKRANAKKSLNTKHTSTTSTHSSTIKTKSHKSLNKTSHATITTTTSTVKKSLNKNKLPLQTTQKRKMAKKQREKTLYVTGPYFVTDNSNLPVLTGVDWFDDKDPEMAPQYRNTFTKYFNVPCLLGSEQSREAQTKSIIQSQNKILSSLKSHMAEAKKKNKQFYLADLPMTPNYSPETYKVYENDPDEYSIPPNQYGFNANNVNPQDNWGQILQVRTDLMDLWSETHPHKSPSSMGSFVSGDTLAVTQTTRVAALIQNRVKNPELYHAFGLDDSVYHTRLTMYAIHVWLYCRAIQYRPVFHGPSYRTSLIKALDSTSEQALYYDFRFLNAKDRHAMIQALLPWYRSFMINLDKSFAALTGGDPEPLYGILYRALYRPNEANRHDPKNTDKIVDKDQLHGFPYSPDLEVFMQDPPSLTHMNNMINYMVNVSYDLQTKSPRDYTMVLNGFMETVDFKHWVPKSTQNNTNTNATTTTNNNKPNIPTTSAEIDQNNDQTTKMNSTKDNDEFVQTQEEAAVEQPTSILITPPPAPTPTTDPVPTIVGSNVPITSPPEGMIDNTAPKVKLHQGRKLLAKFTPDEMMRWCYPVYQAQSSPYVPGFFQRLSLRLSPPKTQTTNWFVNPRASTEPAWRPPTCSLTVSGRKP